MGHKRPCQHHVLNKNTMVPSTTHDARRKKLLLNGPNDWRGLPEELVARSLVLKGGRRGSRPIGESEYSPSLATYLFTSALEVFVIRYTKNNQPE